MEKTRLILRNKRFFVIVVLSFVLLNCSIKAQKEKRDVYGFNDITYTLPGTLEIIQSDKESLELEGNSDDLEKIITKVDGNTLKIYTKNHSNGLGNVKVYVSVIDLKEMSVAGSGDVIFKSKLETDRLELDLSGSGNIQCENLICGYNETNIAGSGDVFLGGEAKDKVELNIAGSGDIRAENLKTREVEVNIAGSGSAKVWVTDNLETNIIGSGDVYYKGNPLVNAESVGSGSTRSME